MTAQRLRRYRLVCTTEPRRCHWASRSYWSTGPFTMPPGLWDLATAHARRRHPGRLSHLEVRRWRPWLRWVALAAVGALLPVVAVGVDLLGEQMGWWG